MDRGEFILRLIAIATSVAPFAWGAMVVRQSLQTDDGGSPLGAICSAAPSVVLLTAAAAIWSSTTRPDQRRGFDVVPQEQRSSQEP